MNALAPLNTCPDLIAETVATFNARTARSKQHAARARKVLADKSPMAMAFSPDLKEAFYPITAEKAGGAYLWDIDGHRYVDILMGLGTNLLGHNPPALRKALEHRLLQGFPIGPQSDLAAETAERLCALTGQDRVAFSTTGTEAVASAIRIARATTGRRKVAIFTNAYHGHFDLALHKAKRIEYFRRGALQRAQSGPLRMLRPLLQKMMITGAQPAFSGIPGTQSGDIMMLEYGNPRALEILRKKAGQLAAILVEPVQSRMPELQPKEFLHGLRDIADTSKAALIFDEMISGFRVAQGGGQEYFGVRADLATYGKIAGGGLPLSLIAGQNRFMDHIDGGAWQFGDDSAPQTPTTFFAGTHCRHPLALTAANAMAKHLQEEGPALQAGLNARATELVARLNASCETAGLPVRYIQFGSFFAIANSQSRISPKAVNIMSLLLLNKGIHLRAGDRGGFLSSAHTPEDIDLIHSAILSSLTELAVHGFLQSTGANP